MAIKNILDKFYTWIDSKTKRKDGKTDYCSIAPDVWFGVDIAPACEIHDTQYITESISKEESDQQLKENIILIGGNNWKFKIIGQLYYWGVKYGGQIYKW